MDTIAAEKALREAKEVLDAHGIEYWLNFGTILGAVRNGKFIEYDDDIEFSAWSHKVTEKQIRDVSRELCQHGFNVYYSTLTDYISIRKYNVPIAFSMFTLNGDKAERPLEDEFVIHKPGMRSRIAGCFYYLSEVFARNRVGKLNIETFRRFRGVLVFLAVGLTKLFPSRLRRRVAVFLRMRAIKGMEKSEVGKTRIPAKFYLNLQDFEFYGEAFKVPKPPEQYVRFVYGPDWRVPMKDWKFPDHCNRNITGVEFVNERWEYTRN